MRVLIASPLQPELAERIALAAPGGVTVEYHPELLPRARYACDHDGDAPDFGPGERERWHNLVRSAEVMFGFDWRHGNETLEAAERLRWVQATSAGLAGSLRTLGPRSRAIQWTTAAGVHSTPLTEFVLLALLYFTKDVPRLERLRLERKWQSAYCGEELAGRTACVLGSGQIGTRIARLLAGLDVEVTGVARTAGRAVPPGFARLVGPEELDSALAVADFIVVTLPGTVATHHLLDERRLRLLKDSAIFVNVGRGTVVEEAALVAALRQGRLRGAALDVVEHEPLPATSELWSLPNVLLSPHSAANVPLENDRIVDLFLDNLSRYQRGEPLRNLYHHEREY